MTSAIVTLNRPAMSRPVDLDTEMEMAVKAVTDRHIAAMERMGCTAQAIATVGAYQPPFGVMRCDTRRSPFFEPTNEPYGVDAVVMPVLDDGTLIDLIAWRSLAIDNWLWRHGDGWALGIDAIVRPSPWGGFDDIILHATPIDWLRSGGQGACILSWVETALIRQLNNFSTIHCPDRRVAQKLREIICRPARVPLIVEGQQRERAA